MKAIMTKVSNIILGDLEDYDDEDGNSDEYDEEGSDEEDAEPGIKFNLETYKQNK
jgi:hypothetical protein